MMVGRTVDALFPKKKVDFGDVILKVEHLDRQPLTKDVNFNIRSGEIVGLAGLVGSGRSELAQTIFGVTPAMFFSLARRSISRAQGMPKVWG